MELIEKIKKIQNLRISPYRMRMRFTIPVGRRKRWWEFWKKDVGKKALAELMIRYKN